MNQRAHAHLSSPGFFNPLSGGDSIIEALLLEFLKPGEVTPQLVRRALNRARRLGLYWRILSPLERAFLNVASRLKVKSYHSPRVKELLAMLIARIESYTMRGRIIKLGLWRALSGGRLNSLPVHQLQSLVDWAKRKTSYIRYLGRSMLETIKYFTHLTW